MAEKKPRKSTRKQNPVPTGNVVNIHGNVYGSNLTAGNKNQSAINPNSPILYSDQPLPTYNPTDELPEPGDLPQGSRLPFGRNPLFTGREADLKSIADSLLGKNSGAVIHQAVAGMGGLGKTQLAVEFAYRCGGFFRGVHWLNMARAESFLSEVAACGAEMELADFPDDFPSQVTLTLNTWKARGPRLLILDNFEEVARVTEVMRHFHHSNLRVLVTSRHSDWPLTSGLRPIPLELFTGQESLRFLRSATPKRSDSDPDLNLLADKLGHLPLALELASRYLNGHPRLNVTDYLKQAQDALEHPSMQNWRKDLPSPTAHDLDLQSTFALSWRALAQAAVPGEVEGQAAENDPSTALLRSSAQGEVTEIAQKIFKAAGFLAPNTSIPLETFEKALKISSEQCDEALILLYGLGLLREVDALPAIHPLLAAYARSLGGDDKTILEALADVFGTLSNEANNTGLPARFASIKPHVPILVEYAENENVNSAGVLWNNYGYHLWTIADYSGARVSYERALKIDEAAFGPDHPNVARDVNNLGSVMQDLGDLAGARTAYERALKIDEAAFGPDHPKVDRDVNNLGSVMQDLGDLTGARSAFERALKIDEAAFGPDHPKVAIRVNNLGNVMKALGDLAGARSAYERALKIFEANLGSDHPNVATLVNNLGGVMQDLGDLAGARSTYERALKIDEAAFGPDHPNVATDVNNLGGVMKDLGDLAGARSAYERALKIDEAAFGPDHPEVATDVNNLGMVMQDLGDLAGARSAFERALEIFKKFLPPDHPNIKIVQENLDSLKK